jgi:hypothetical protein
MGVFMLSQLVLHALQYGSYAIEISLVVCLLLRGWWKTYPSFLVYATAFALIDAVLRPTVLYTYGWTSAQFSRCYWLTDLALTLGAFLLICFFFRRACANKKDLWPILRTMLISVFIIVAFISSFTMSRHYESLGWRFTIELSQNVYFACLVLNTLLYFMLKYVDSADETLKFLVCGLGIEFAGSAAGAAFAYMMPGWLGNVAFASLIAQFCTLGMLLTWLYAATRKRERVPVRVLPQSYRPVPAFAEVHAQGTH